MKTSPFFLALILVFALPIDTLAARAGSGRSSGGYRSYRGAKAIDGDTFRHQGQRYRLREYNAPEIGQKGSSSATGNLQKKLDSGYEYRPFAKDAYGRSLVEEKAP
jgi:endonuclease YncB( thermonuclease family)